MQKKKKLVSVRNFTNIYLLLFKNIINNLLKIWPLNPGDTALFYAIAGVWGMADGVWNTQINGDFYKFINFLDIKIFAFFIKMRISGQRGI